MRDHMSEYYVSEVQIIQKTDLLLVHRLQLVVVVNRCSLVDGVGVQGRNTSSGRST